MCSVAALAGALRYSPTVCRADLLLGTAFDGGVLRVDETTGATLPGSVTPGSAGLAFTSGVTVGPDGNIYVSSRGTGEVLFYDGENGAPLPSPRPGGRDGLFATLATPTTPMSTPGPLRFGPDGNLYVSDFGGSAVWRFNGETGAFSGYATNAFVGPPAGLTFGPDGDLFVGDFGSASVIREDNGTPSFFISSQSGGLLTPSSLLFLSDGDLLVADLFGNQILRYDENGQNPSQFAVIPPMNPPTQDNPTGSNFPSDLTLDADGNIVLAVLGYTNPPDNRGKVMRFDQQGNLLDTILEMQTPIGSVAWIPPADAIVGDYDGDGTVGMGDYNKWRADFGKQVANGSGADGNRNGSVDAADYVVWRKSDGPGAQASAAIGVPEPGTIAFVCCGAFFPASVRFRNRSGRSTR